MKKAEEVADHFPTVSQVSLNPPAAGRLLRTTMRDLEIHVSTFQNTRQPLNESNRQRNCAEFLRASNRNVNYPLGFVVSTIFPSCEELFGVSLLS
jgi:hypothetical protein